MRERVWSKRHKEPETAKKTSHNHGVQQQQVHDKVDSQASREASSLDFIQFSIRLVGRLVGRQANRPGQLDPVEPQTSRQPRTNRQAKTLNTRIQTVL